VRHNGKQSGGTFLKQKPAGNRFTLNFRRKRRILEMRTSLSVCVAREFTGWRRDEWA